MSPSSNLSACAAWGAPSRTILLTADLSHRSDGAWNRWLQGNTEETQLLCVYILQSSEMLAPYFYSVWFESGFFYIFLNREVTGVFKIPEISRVLAKVGEECLISLLWQRPVIDLLPSVCAGWVISLGRSACKY